ncbi:MAG TPA: hypothetical protein ENI23_02690 [bacterium]|nr:hypothetical protein [bacterium]
MSDLIPEIETARSLVVDTAIELDFPKQYGVLSTTIIYLVEKFEISEESLWSSVSEVYRYFSLQVGREINQDAVARELFEEGEYSIESYPRGQLDTMIAVAATMLILYEEEDFFFELDAAKSIFIEAKARTEKAIALKAALVYLADETIPVLAEVPEYQWRRDKDGSGLLGDLRGEASGDLEALLIRLRFFFEERSLTGNGRFITHPSFISTKIIYLASLGYPAGILAKLANHALINHDFEFRYTENKDVFRNFLPKANAVAKYLSLAYVGEDLGLSDTDLKTLGRVEQRYLLKDTIGSLGAEHQVPVHEVLPALAEIITRDKILFSIVEARTEGVVAKIALARLGIEDPTQRQVQQYNNILWGLFGNTSVRFSSIGRFSELYNGLLYAHARERLGDDMGFVTELYEVLSAVSASKDTLLRAETANGASVFMKAVICMGSDKNEWNGREFDLSTFKKGLVKLLSDKRSLSEISEEIARHAPLRYSYILGAVQIGLRVVRGLALISANGTDRPTNLTEVYSKDPKTMLLEVGLDVIEVYETFVESGRNGRIVESQLPNGTSKPPRHMSRVGMEIDYTLPPLTEKEMDVFKRVGCMAEQSVEGMPMKEIAMFIRSLKDIEEGVSSSVELFLKLLITEGYKLAYNRTQNGGRRFKDRDDIREALFKRRALYRELRYIVLDFREDLGTAEAIEEFQEEELFQFVSENFDLARYRRNPDAAFMHSVIAAGLEAVSIPLSEGVSPEDILNYFIDKYSLEDEVIRVALYIGLKTVERSFASG